MECVPTAKLYKVVIYRARACRAAYFIEIWIVFPKQFMEHYYVYPASNR